MLLLLLARGHLTNRIRKRNRIGLAKETQKWHNNTNRGRKNERIIFSWFGKLFRVNRMWCYVCIVLLYGWVFTGVSVRVCMQKCYYGDKVIIVFGVCSQFGLTLLFFIYRFIFDRVGTFRTRQFQLPYEIILHRCVWIKVHIACNQLKWHSFCDTV